LNVKDLAIDSALFNSLYRTGMRARGAWLARRGGQWRALGARMRALRAAPAHEHSAEDMALARSWVEWGCRDRQGRLLDIGDNRWLAAFLGTPEAEALRNHFSKCAMHHRIRLREPNDEDRERQGNLLVLKEYDPSSGEKGALLLSYSEALRRFPAMFDIGRMAARYAFVLEPSSWGYEDPAFFLYIGADADVVVQAPWRRDYHFILELQTNLHPIRIGAGDWVDPAIFSSGRARAERRFDVVVVSSWSPWKRHEDLFRAAAKLKRDGTILQIALVGYPLGWTQEKIVQLIRRYQLQDHCTLFESITPAEVAQVVGDSRAYVLLSRREGANKALYEAMFCDTPVVVYENHRGVNTDMVRQGVGTLYQDGRLHEALLRILNRGEDFTPRAWAESYSGYQNATDEINAVLQRMSQTRGLPWTRDIGAKRNAPDIMYASSRETDRFEGEYRELEQYLR
jgi:glycosyltransferase involved in cell wall biosynthesis